MNSKFPNQPWNPPADRVLVVGARHARRVARKYSVYWCQNDRSFQPSRWIAFYKDGVIDTYAEIVGGPDRDVVVGERPEWVQELPNLSSPKDKHQVFRLRNIREVGPIRNDKMSAACKTVAWTQGQRYTTIEKLLSAKSTSALE